MDRISVLEFISPGPKTRQEILDGGMVYNARFRLLVDELERQGLVRYQTDRETVIIAMPGRREIRNGH